jgi:Mor family transcriptional regulator
MAYPEKKERNDEMVELRKTGEPIRSIAKKYKLDHSTVYEILLRRRDEWEQEYEKSKELPEYVA